MTLAAWKARLIGTRRKHLTASGAGVASGPVFPFTHLQQHIKKTPICLHVGNLITNKDNMDKQESPKFHRWRIRKELPDGLKSSCEYQSHCGPVTATQVLSDSTIRQWLGNDKVSKIYHPQD